jgi:hypothetical protein
VSIGSFALQENQTRKIEQVDPVSSPQPASSSRQFSVAAPSQSGRGMQIQAKFQILQQR